MEESEDSRRKSAYDSGKMEALLIIVASIVTQLPERAMFCVGADAKRFCDKAQYQARNTDNDLTRDFAAGVWDVVMPLREAIDQQIHDLGEGGIVRTIQPFPIPPEEWVDEERGF
jgi:hypothetical protein